MTSTMVGCEFAFTLTAVFRAAAARATAKQSAAGLTVKECSINFHDSVIQALIPLKRISAKFFGGLFVGNIESAIRFLSQSNVV